MAEVVERRRRLERESKRPVRRMTSERDFAIEPLPKRSAKTAVSTPEVRRRAVRPASASHVES